MITYLYWAVILALVALCLYGGIRLGGFGKAVILAAIVLLTGWVAYYFHYQQIFVKRLGGIMHITVPAGQRHLGATWKEENLWIENFDPQTNECIFFEYSKGNLLQGRVVIDNCNPLLGESSVTTPAQGQ